MPNLLSISALDPLTANTGQMLLTLLTASGNRVEGQCLASLPFTQTTQTVHEPDQSPHRREIDLTVNHSQGWYRSGTAPRTESPRRKKGITSGKAAPSPGPSEPPSGPPPSRSWTTATLRFSPGSMLSCSSRQTLLGPRDQALVFTAPARVQEGQGAPALWSSMPPVLPWWIKTRISSLLTWRVPHARTSTTNGCRNPWISKQARQGRSSGRPSLMTRRAKPTNRSPSIGGKSREMTT